MDEISKYVQVLMQNPHRNIPNNIIHTAYHNFRINHFFFFKPIRIDY